MARVQATVKSLQRKYNTRRDNGTLTLRKMNPGENLVQLVKSLDIIKVTPEKLEFNSKYIQAPDGSIIEY